MTATATLAAPENRVAGLLAAIADDPLLGERTIDANEAAPGRWQVIVYFDQPPDKAERAALARFGRFTIAELPETDWVAKSLEGLKPVRAGRFLVHGAHDRDRVKPNDIAIEIEAGQAFGTGHHGTTIGCLLAIAAGSQDADDPERARCRHRLRRARHRAGEDGPRRGCWPATSTRWQPRSREENVRLNGVAAFVRIVTAAGLAGRAFTDRAPYDLVVANILAGPLAALAPAIRRAVAPGGTVILSGLLPEQRARIVATYRSTGLVLVRSLIVDGLADAGAETAGPFRTRMNGAQGTALPRIPSSFRRRPESR